MRSFSILTVLSALAASVAAYTTPTSGPEGNPIGSPLENEQVPVGKPYTIVWTPDAPGVGTVTLVLLRGPSTNVQPMYPIVEKTPNTGSYVWTPATDLESDTTHYALQLIEDSTGRFQWGMQFGIENPDIPKGGATSTTATDDDALTTTVTATSTSTAVVTVTGTKPAETETETETETATSTVEETTTTKASNLTVTLITSTTKAAQTTEIETTTVASNATTSATQPAVPTKSGDEEGAASKMGASIAIVAVAAAAFAFF